MDVALDVKLVTMVVMKVVRLSFNTTQSKRAIIQSPAVTRIPSIPLLFFNNLFLKFFILISFPNSKTGMH